MERRGFGLLGFDCLNRVLHLCLSPLTNTAPISKSIQIHIKKTETNSVPSANLFMCDVIRFELSVLFSLEAT